MQNIDVDYVGENEILHVKAYTAYTYKNLQNLV